MRDAVSDHRSWGYTMFQVFQKGLGREQLGKRSLETISENLFFAYLMPVIMRFLAFFFGFSPALLVIPSALPRRLPIQI